MQQQEERAEAIAAPTRKSFKRRFLFMVEEEHRSEKDRIQKSESGSPDLCW
jgi:hypothetical protein